VIDLHTHILPGIDDGSQSMEESLEMCRLAVADGITTMVATPHYNQTGSISNSKVLYSAISRLQEALQSESLELTILPGCELPVFPELNAHVSVPNSCLTINNSTYFLLEFRPFAVPANIEQFLVNILDSGLTPIIAHPERCDWFSHNTALLTRLVNQGVMLQLTAGSITGGFGVPARDFSLRLIRQGLAHIIASDAHDRSDRPPLLSEAVSLVTDLIGSDKATAMVTTTPAAIISNQPLKFSTVEIHQHPPPIKSRSWLRRLLDAAA
jgi:protein-tyrosine phosphatase